MGMVLTSTGTRHAPLKKHTLHGRGAKDTSSDMDMVSGRTKLFNIMSSMEFNRRLQGSNVESFSCHPGVAKTDLYAPGKMDKDKLTSKACPLMTRKGPS